MTAYERPRPIGPDDPWEGRPPFFRRPVVRGTITLVAVGSFLILTLMSTCAPRRRVSPETTTTTTEIVAEN
ncbi:hypothetical protein HQ535_13245, partial [bacterium]|nr:hypothetical protein [bacterium]